MASDPALSWPQRGLLWLRLGLRLLLTGAALWLLVRFGPPLISLFAPFLLALVLSRLLSPAVKALHKRLGLSRRVLSLVLLLAVFLGAGGLLWALGAAALRETASLAGNWQELLASLQLALNDLSAAFSRLLSRLPAAARETADGLGDELFQWLDTAIPRLLSAALDRTASIAKALPSFAVATVVFLMASYFITADYPRLRAMAADRLPKSARAVASLVRRTASAAFGGYVKAEVLLSVGVFFILLLGFLLVRQPYALLLALVLAVLDFIPIIGSGTVLVPWAGLSLLMGDPRHAVSLLAVWALVALFRRLAEPKVLGDQTGLSPILSLVSVYVGMRLAGVAGMILGPVLCLVLRNIGLSGVLDGALADLRLAAADLSAILRGGKEG